MEEAKETITILHPETKFPSREEVSQSIGSQSRTGSPYFSKYEYTELLSLRVIHLSNGATPMVSLAEFDKRDPNFMWNVAKKEIADRKLEAYIIGRTLPDRSIEYWSAVELQWLM